MPTDIKMPQGVPIQDSSEGIPHELKALRISVKGVVQGVGFRPFVHNLAVALELKGFVLNSQEGVLIHVESKQQSRLHAFLDRLRGQAPALARIQTLEALSVQPCGYGDFKIRESLSAGGGYVLVSPDIAVCGDCVREMRDEANRRFHYPFINCTNCGPRYTITREIPYDRPKTTMAVFEICPKCKAEYQDPADRRFHAQPISCPSCGPTLWLVPSSASEGSFAKVCGDEAMAYARQLLRQGKILAIRGLGGFHIACDATNHESVRRLRECKRKSNKPFAVMCGDLEAVRRFAYLSRDEEEILQSIRSPICLLPRREGPTRLSPLVAPGNKYLGVMLPYTPLHMLLFQDGLDILVMTSGNWSEEPIVCRNQEALEKLSPLVDAFLLHDREIHVRVDDSVVRCFRGKEQVIRRARGFVPTPVDLGRHHPPVLGCGAHLKHTFCLIRDRFAILSQHIGDLENLESLQFFQEVLEHLSRLYGAKPKILCHDLHPNYLTSRWAMEQTGMKCIGVQHHHAHVVSCMAEWGLEGQVIGVALDGTGYGTDGAIWGGEVLLAERDSFKRAAHLRYTPLPGGESAIREPWRMALSHLITAGLDEGELLRWASAWGEARARNLLLMIRKGLHSPPTSSMGRLFDAVSSILGIRHRISFEGEAAMDLEMASDPRAEGSYEVDIKGQDPFVLDPSPLILSIWKDKERGEPISTIGGRFHRSVATTVALSQHLRDRSRLAPHRHLWPKSGPRGHGARERACGRPRHRGHGTEGGTWCGEPSPERCRPPMGHGGKVAGFGERCSFLARSHPWGTCLGSTRTGKLYWACRGALGEGDAH